MEDETVFTLVPRVVPARQWVKSVPAPDEGFWELFSRGFSLGLATSMAVVVVLLASGFVPADKDPVAIEVAAR